jgi:hypothetical protein
MGFYDIYYKSATGEYKLTRDFAEILSKSKLYKDNKLDKNKKSTKDRLKESIQQGYLEGDCISQLWTDIKEDFLDFEINVNRRRMYNRTFKIYSTAGKPQQSICPKAFRNNRTNYYKNHIVKEKLEELETKIIKEGYVYGTVVNFKFDGDVLNLCPKHEMWDLINKEANKKKDMMKIDKNVLFYKKAKELTVEHLRKLLPDCELIMWEEVGKKYTDSLVNNPSNESKKVNTLVMRVFIISKTYLPDVITESDFSREFSNQHRRQSFGRAKIGKSPFTRMVPSKGNFPNFLNEILEHIKDLSGEVEEDTRGFDTQLLRYLYRFQNYRLTKPLEKFLPIPKGMEPPGTLAKGGISRLYKGPIPFDDLPVAKQYAIINFIRNTGETVYSIEDDGIFAHDGVPYPHHLPIELIGKIGKPLPPYPGRNKQTVIEKLYKTYHRIVDGIRLKVRIPVVDYVYGDGGL